ncbi:MAG: YgiT-type zinc finger protein [Chloroflexi bacterium]|nr:YgiT-type zinc finger protein [Chloroflexota bacterium]
MTEPVETNPHPEKPCRECRAGIMRLRFITFFTWLDDELLTVPGFPAWICDVCGRRDYDERALSWLTALLNPDAGKPSESRKVKPAPFFHQPPARPVQDELP